MPWKECHVVDERLRFIARLLQSASLEKDPRRAVFSCQWSVISSKSKNPCKRPPDTEN
jgi:hypothetical protein